MVTTHPPRVLLPSRQVSCLEQNVLCALQVLRLNHDTGIAGFEAICT